mgnify:FL=1
MLHDDGSIPRALVRGIGDGGERNWELAVAIVPTTLLFQRCVMARERWTMRLAREGSGSIDERENELARGAKPLLGS